MQAVIDVIVQVLNKSAILIGLIAFIGLVAQKKPIGATIAGTVKTALGFLIMGAGANVVIAAISPLGDLTQAGFNLQGALPVNEVFTALAQQKLGNVISLTFALSFILSILIARFTPLKFVFLSGHHVLFMSVLTCGLLGFSVIPNNPTLLVIVASVLSAISFVISPWLSAPFMEKVIGSKDFVMGHFGTGSYVLAGFLGQFVGDPKDSTENIKMPEWIGFMKEPLVAMGFVMWLIYLIAAGAAVSAVGVDKVKELFGSTDSWILSSLMGGLNFAAGIGVILLGVRMILADIVPAFRGFAEKIVPNAIPALDCPTVFPYAQNAILIGYLASIVGGVLIMLIQIAANGAIGAVILPSMIIHFFLGATSAIYGNATGGWKGAVLGGFMSGVVFTLLAGTAYVSLGQLGFSNSTFGDTGFGIMGNYLALLGSFFR